MSLVFLVLLALSIVILTAAEWPRLVALKARRRPEDPAPRRVKRRQRAEAADERGEQAEREAFARAVQRDLDSLPVTDDDLRKML